MSFILGSNNSKTLIFNFWFQFFPYVRVSVTVCRQLGNNVFVVSAVGRWVGGTAEEMFAGHEERRCSQVGG